ncbi:UDP-N-acetylmuramoyl-tripeptide--D-alanyl-D-alanine ligase [Candidatus Synchoanobacter obligatus]|uniref:Mur ligase central domain-containing protein n=1 Tax=Candidatus Synchoanobacter obligatus TaxID=2919597 RepID=A0ABT1L5V0_9GAMM|nr:Mur ligase family protein [Candidatus Synchoanobacter obligatus]MCP8352540.1 hypothetical protein [Candidatus Synchoanobacter obligatus]
MLHALLGQRGLNVPLSATVHFDSRVVRNGDVFVALNTGGEYINHALDQGASAVVTTVDSDHPKVHVVGCTTRWLGELARAYRLQLNATVIGVTGSVGKTSLTQCLRYSLGHHAQVIATLGNENNELGVCFTLLRAYELTEFVIVEMGVAKPGDMDILVDIVRPDIAIVTHIGPSHLEFLKNREGVWAEKQKIMRFATGVIVPDSMVSKSQMKTISFGVSPYADVVVSETELTFGHQRMSLVGIPSYRKNMIAAAFALHVYLKIPMNLSGIKWPRLRMSTYIHLSGAKIIEDCYNANYSSCLVSLQHAAQENVDLVVLGEMAGLGHLSAYYHELLGHVLSTLGIREVWLIGVHHQATLLSYMGEATYYHCKKVLEKDLNCFLRPGVVVLVKGSRHLALEEVYV